MEDFIDYLLFLLLLGVISAAGLLIFLFLNAPTLAYLFVSMLMSGLGVGVGIIGKRFRQKARMGPYYPLFLTISQIKKETTKLVKHLDRDLRKLFSPLLTKTEHLHREAQRCIWKIRDLDKTIAAIESTPSTAYRTSEWGTDDGKAYYNNIHFLESTRTEYIKQLHQVLHFFQEFNSQIIAVKYSQGSTEIENTLTDTLDELLIEIKALKEIR